MTAAREYPAGKGAAGRRRERPKETVWEDEERECDGNASRGDATPDPSATQTRRPKVVATHISKWYGELEVLHDVSLDIHEQEFVCLLGPSGCGKTTLLRITRRPHPARRRHGRTRRRR